MMSPAQPKKRFQGPDPVTGAEDDVQELVQDPMTKTYIPRDEAIEFEGQFFASQKSLKQFQQQQH